MSQSCPDMGFKMSQLHLLQAPWTYFQEENDTEDVYVIEEPPVTFLGNNASLQSNDVTLPTETTPYR